MGFDLLGSLDPQRPAPDDAAPRPRAAAPEAVCSRRGCSRPAQWTLLWNNPRVHTPERRKAWLACDEHREHLADFLGQRGFLKTITPFGAPDDATPDAAASQDSPPRTSPGDPTGEDSPHKDSSHEPGAGDGRAGAGDSGVVRPEGSGRTH
ncbi:hypothetical protein [Kocuria marina]|uniref:hypothetical protein n=1 Tax=Kocuria marina TaxID=223184 RepID=UPI000A8B18FE|nr:hypothetical protein [Kocuria marina]